jgi:hypothetical protein
MDTSPTHQCWLEVEKEEQKIIAARAGSDGVVGLAISGGGIRSATFALGVLESLKEYGLLSRVHYLSTVSGGGYIGAWLSTNCRRRKDWLTSDWTASIDHLRRYSNYLSPQLGFFSADTWSMLTIWLRNTLLIQATVILAIACALLVPRLLFWVFHHYPSSGSARWAPVLLFIVGIVGIAGNQWQLTAGRREAGDERWPSVDLLKAESWRAGAGWAIGFLALALGAMRLLEFDPFAVYQVADEGHNTWAGVARVAEAFLIGALLVLCGFCLQPVVVKLVAKVSAHRPERVNYTQGYVQLWVVAPLMIVALLVTSILWAQATGREEVTSFSPLGEYAALVSRAWQFWPFHLSIVFVSFWLLSLVAVSSRHDLRKVVIALAAPAVAVASLHALLCAIVLIFQQFNAHVGGEWMAFVWGPALVAIAFVLSIIVMTGILGRDSTDGVREWWSRLGAWLAIYAAAWMVIAVSAVYGPKWVSWAWEQLEHATWAAVAGFAGWAATVAGGLMAGNSPETGGTPTGLRATFKDVLARVAPFVFIAGVLLAVAHAIHLVVVLNGGNSWWMAGSEPMVGVPAIMLIACLLVTLLLAARVDINEFSLNAFYRNRLVRCYLGATRDEAERNPQNFTGFDDDDDHNLAVDVKDKGGPFHIVNCALNLGGSSDLALHTRHSASFTLTPLFCGSAYASRDQFEPAKELGFVKTCRFGHREKGPTIGQAMAVSGAAASPNMGYHTSSVTAFLMTLFNIRLGWWFPNPREAADGSTSPHFSLAYLTAELFGGATDRSPFVMVSDGGHFENLAAYELIRRRCRVVIISDGECDVDYEFGGLGTLIRMCEVDFRCRITINVDDLRPVGKGARWSKRRFAVGDITYNDQSTGFLIYMKASMTRYEDISVRQYKSSHPDFPHETTSDQFYGEDQFESYRRLGRDIGKEVFGPLRGESSLVSAALKLRAAERNRELKRVPPSC